MTQKKKKKKEKPWQWIKNLFPRLDHINSLKAMCSVSKKKKKKKLDMFSFDNEGGVESKISSKLQHLWSKLLHFFRRFGTWHKTYGPLK